jgi:hypothetical protein
LAEPPGRGFGSAHFTSLARKRFVQTNDHFASPIPSFAHLRFGRESCHEMDTNRAPKGRKWNIAMAEADD